MKGIGKIDLLLKLVEEIQKEFDYFIWRSLFVKLFLKEFLESLIKFLLD